MCLERRFVFTHETVREWEAKLAPLIAEQLRQRRRGVVGERSGPRILDSGLSEISIAFQAAAPKVSELKYTASGVRRPRAL